MNPYKGLRVLMDKIPEGDRLLLRQISWGEEQTHHQPCGCLFGTIWPDGRDPDVDHYLSFKRIFKFVEFPKTDTWKPESWYNFARWAKGLGLTLEIITELQNVNDRFVGDLGGDPFKENHAPSCRVRWIHVYEYIHRKEREWDDMEAEKERLLS